MSCRPPKWGIYVQTCTQTNTSYLPVSAVASVALCAFPISFSQGSRSAAPSGSCYTNEIHRRSSEEAPTLCPRRYLHLCIDVTGLWPSQPHRSDAALVKHFSTILCNTFSFHQMPLQSVLWVLLLFFISVVPAHPSADEKLWRSLADAAVSEWTSADGFAREIRTCMAKDGLTGFINVAK